MFGARAIALILLVLAPAAGANASDLVTYFGGSGPDVGNAIAVDAAGNIYIAGSSSSLDLPQTGAGIATSPPVPQTCTADGISWNCTPAVGFIAKLDASGSAVLYSTYFATSITGMVVDAAGNLYVTGTASRTDFPTTIGAYETTPPANLMPSPGFVSKISPDGSALVFSTYVDGSPSSIAVDPEGNVVVGGIEDPGNGNTAFVLKLSADGSRAIFNQLFDPFVFQGLAIDGGGNTTLVLRAIGSPTPSITRLDPAGATILAPTPVPSGVFASVNSVCVDNNGNIYLAGSVAGSITPTYGEYSGSEDGFVAKLDPSATNLVYFAYLGGPGDGYVSASGIAVDSAGRAYVTGTTSSRTFPVTSNAHQPFAAGGTCWTVAGGGEAALMPCTEGFVAELNEAGTALLYSSYLGGSGGDSLSPIALGAANQVYVAGFSSSSNLPATPGTLQPNLHPGGCPNIDITPEGQPYEVFPPCPDAFVAKIDLAAPSAPIQVVVNAGSYEMPPVAPGTLITLFGAGLGPVPGISAVPNSGGVIGTNLGGVEVTFDGTPAPVLYAQSNQVNAVAPYEIAGRAKTSVQVSYNGTQIDFGSWPVAGVAPAIFSLDGSGRGQGAILNEDGTINGPGNPAAKGSIVSIFATGAGVTNPPSNDGFLAAPPLARPDADVAVWFSYDATSTYAALVSGQVTYAGAAPRLVNGVLQVNAVVPEDAAIGSAVPVFLQIGTNQASQMGITLAIQ